MIRVTYARSPDLAWIECSLCSKLWTRHFFMQKVDKIVLATPNTGDTMTLSLGVGAVPGIHRFLPRGQYESEVHRSFGHMSTFAEFKFTRIADVPPEYNHEMVVDAMSLPENGFRRRHGINIYFAKVRGLVPWDTPRMIRGLELFLLRCCRPHNGRSRLPSRIGRR